MENVGNLTYNQAVAELDKILAALRGDDCDVDNLTAMTKRAAELLAACRSRLTATESELREILEQLEAGTE